MELGVAPSVRYKRRAAPSLCPGARAAGARAAGRRRPVLGRDRAVTLRQRRRSRSSGQPRLPRPGARCELLLSDWGTSAASTGSASSGSRCGFRTPRSSAFRSPQRARWAGSPAARAAPGITAGSSAAKTGTTFHQMARGGREFPAITGTTRNRRIYDDCPESATKSGSGVLKSPPLSHLDTAPVPMVT